MSRLILVASAVVVFVNAVETALNSDNSSTWRLWFSVLISRSLYFILAALIVGSLVVTVIKNKWPNIRTTVDTKAIAVNPWKLQTNIVNSMLPELPQSTKGYSFTEMYSDNTSEDQLKDALVKNQALLKEIDELNNIRLSLEQRSGVLEREKLEVEDCLDNFRLQSQLENEQLKKEKAVIQRQLKEIMQEKELLSREAESSARESRMTECSLRDQAQLSERLELARREVLTLQRDVDVLRMERDTAMAVASDLVSQCQGIAGESTHLIAKYLKKEFDGHIPKGSDLEAIVDCTADNCSDCNRADNMETENPNNEDMTDDNEPENNKGDDCGRANIGPIYINSSENEDMTEGQLYTFYTEELGFRPVTSSAAFRNFLVSNFVD